MYSIAAFVKDPFVIQTFPSVTPEMPRMHDGLDSREVIAIASFISAARWTGLDL
jgi:hypothetical protein